MKQEKKLSKINLYDKFNAAFVSMITPEMSDLKRNTEAKFLFKYTNFSQTI